MVEDSECEDFKQDILYHLPTQANGMNHSKHRHSWSRGPICERYVWYTMKEALYLL